jgi:dethiobiotin synthetase
VRAVTSIHDLFRRHRGQGKSPEDENPAEVAPTGDEAAEVEEESAGAEPAEVGAVAIEEDVEDLPGAEQAVDDRGSEPVAPRAFAAPPVGSSGIGTVGDGFSLPVAADPPVSEAVADEPEDPPESERAEPARGEEPVVEERAEKPAENAETKSAARPAEAGEWRGIVLVTGTDTDVGKTIVTSAIAAAAQAAGLRVAVIKPGQTGTANGAPTDIDLITRLASPETTRTLASYPDPLAPLAAARVSELPPLELYEVVDAIRAEAGRHDLVLVEGAGGLLVPMGVRPSGEAWTFADLATTLGVGTIVVSRAGLGTLNHTALTLEALARRGVQAGVVLGAWPAEPELVHWANLSELVPHLVGALPDGAGAMDPGVFRRSAPGWLTPALYGVLDNWRVWADEIH